MNGYRYDLHVHTKETSRCGRIPAAEICAEYASMGYAGIAVTDHLHEEYISSLKCRNNWDQCVDEYMAGYRGAKEAGDKLGLDIIFGLEIRFPENDNDYLIYGVDRGFLLRNPYLYRSGQEEFFKRHGNEILMIQAHPFRGGVNLRPQFLHGVEIINCNPRHDSGNGQALALAEENPKLLRTCGSDTHRPGDAGRAALVFGTRIPDSFACMDALTRKAYYLECDEYNDLVTRSGLSGHPKELHSKEKPA